MDVATSTVVIVVDASMDWWDWAVRIIGAIGVVAFIMGIKPFTQAIWGRPRVRTRLDRDAQGNDRFLAIYLENRPVKNRLFKRFVHRDSVQSLTVNYRVSEAGSGTIIVPTRQLRIYADEDVGDEGRLRISLPPTYSVAASCMLVIWDHSLGAAVLPRTRNQEAIELKRGYYRADVILSVDGEPLHVTRNFIVGDNPDDLNWAAPER